MSAAPNEFEAAEIKRVYDQTTQEIERLKAKIAAIRKQKAPNLLHTEYKKYKLRESNRVATAREDAKLRDDGEDADHMDDKQSIATTEKVASTNLLSLHCKLTEYKKLSGHGNKVYCAHWNPQDETQLVSVGRDGKLIFWNADTGYKRLAYPLDTEFIMTLKYSPSAELVACGGLDDILSIFPVRMEQTGIYDIEPQIYKAHTGYISCLEYIDNETILSSSGDATIRSWDITKSQANTPTLTYKIHREDVMCIHVNPQNRQLLLTGSVDSTAKIIDFRIKNEELKEENAVTDAIYNGGKNVTHSFYMGYDQDFSKKKRSTDVNVVKWLPEGHSFVAGCDDGTVRLFDVRTGAILNEYSYHRNYLTKGHKGYDGGYDSNGNSMVRTSTNTPIGGNHAHTIDVYEHKDDHDEHAHSDHEDLKNSAAKPIIASDDDPDYYPTDEDMDPTDGVATLDFSKSGAFMFVSYNNDKHKVLTWNMLSGEVVQALKHDGHVPSLAVSSDGRKLVTACWDHHLKLWS
eukprot:25455_1